MDRKPARSLGANGETLPLSEDLLRGAEEIGTFLFGDDGEKRPGDNRRRVYSMIAKGALPVFRIGSIIHARKSSILKRIEEEENLL